MYHPPRFRLFASCIAAAAAAIGFLIAINTGDRTRLSVSVIWSCPVFERDSAFPSLIKAAEAGLARCACSWPERMFSMVSPEPMGMARTKMGFPLFVFALLRLNSLVISVIHFSFSEPYGNTSSREPCGADATASFSFGVSFLQPPGRSRLTNKAIRNESSEGRAKERNCAHKFLRSAANFARPGKICPHGPVPTALGEYLSLIRTKILEISFW